MASEKAVLNDSLVACSAEPETLCWRNNTGMAWQGEPVRGARTVKIEPGMVVLRNARPITFGLPGSGDILGVTSGRAWSVETKTATGRQADTQRNFQRAWTKVGAIYVLARSVDDALRAPRRILEGAE